MARASQTKTTKKKTVVTLKAKPSANKQKKRCPTCGKFMG